MAEMNEQEQKEYQQRLQRRLLIRKERLEAGKVFSADGLALPRRCSSSLSPWTQLTGSWLQ